MLSLRNRHFFLIDLYLLPAVAVLAFALRLDAAGVQQHRSAILLFVALAVPVKLLVFRMTERGLRAERRKSIRGGASFRGGQ